jgi:uncharacterized protein YbcI
MSQQIAQVAKAFEQQRTGHGPTSVTVVLGDDTLVITLYEALSPAERTLASSRAGAALVQEFHQQLFAIAVKSLRQEIERIIGVAIRGATMEVETKSGAIVQVFLLAHAGLADSQITQATTQ